jgi:hypothetical protein
MRFTGDCVHAFYQVEDSYLTESFYHMCWLWYMFFLWIDMSAWFFFFSLSIDWMTSALCLKDFFFFSGKRALDSLFFLWVRYRCCSAVIRFVLYPVSSLLLFFPLVLHTDCLFPLAAFKIFIFLTGLGQLDSVIWSNFPSCLLYLMFVALWIYNFHKIWKKNSAVICSNISAPAQWPLITYAIGCSRWPTAH